MTQNRGAANGCGPSAITKIVCDLGSCEREWRRGCCSNVLLFHLNSTQVENEVHFHASPFSQNHPPTISNRTEGSITILAIQLFPLYKCRERVSHYKCTTITG